MPMHNDRRRRNRGRRRSSVLDWFAEDPWGEPDLAMRETDDDDAWGPSLWEPSDDDTVPGSEDTWSEDPDDDWGPIRRRRGYPSDGL